MSKRNGDSTEDEGSFKRMKEDQLEVRLLVDASTSGGIIGKGGANIKQMRKASGGARIKCADLAPGAQHRLVSVSGSLETATASCGLLAIRLAELEVEVRTRVGDQVSQDQELVFLIPNGQVGCLIGKSGATITSLREACGGSLRMSTEPLERSDEKTLTLRGTPEQVSAGIQLVCDILNQNRDRARPRAPYSSLQQPRFDQRGPPPAMYEPYGERQQHHQQQQHHHHHQQQHQQQRDPQRREPPSAANWGEPPKQRTIIIPVPEEKISCVIGKGGCNVKDIRSRSMAQVRIGALQQGLSDRMVTITGPAQANTIAIQLVYEYMDMYERVQQRR